MAFYRVQNFEASGFSGLHPKGYSWVYMLLCEDGKGTAYIKFGRTNNLGKRLSEVRVGCPLEIKIMGYADCPSTFHAGSVESALHRKFKDRNVTGEWFKFNLTDPAEKKCFNDGWQEVFVKHFGPGHVWVKVNVKRMLDGLRERAVEARRAAGKRRAVTVTA